MSSPIHYDAIPQWQHARFQVSHFVQGRNQPRTVHRVAVEWPNAQGQMQAGWFEDAVTNPQFHSVANFREARLAAKRRGERTIGMFAGLAAASGLAAVQANCLQNWLDQPNRILLEPNFIPSYRTTGRWWGAWMARPPLQRFLGGESVQMRYWLQRIAGEFWATNEPSPCAVKLSSHPFEILPFENFACQVAITLQGEHKLALLYECGFPMDRDEHLLQLKSWEQFGIPVLETVKTDDLMPLPMPDKQATLSQFLYQQTADGWVSVLV